MTVSKALIFGFVYSKTRSILYFIEQSGCITFPYEIFS